MIKNGEKLTFPIQTHLYLTSIHSKLNILHVLSYEQTSIASPFPTHLGRLITRCPKGIHTAKLKTKTAQKISYTSTKTWEILTKTSEIFEKTWEIFSKMSDVFLETLGNPPNSTLTLRPLNHKNRGKESRLPKTTLLPSTFF